MGQAKFLTVSWAFLIGGLFNLDYSRVEVAIDARRRG